MDQIKSNVGADVLVSLSVEDMISNSDWVANLKAKLEESGVSADDIKEAI